MYTRHKAGKLENTMAADNREERAKVAFLTTVKSSSSSSREKVARQRRESKKDACVKKGDLINYQGTQTCAQF